MTAQQQSITDDLRSDGSQYDSPEVVRIKRIIAVDTTRRIYIGGEKYHAVPGCPRGECEAATIETAIEQNISACNRCNPPEYRTDDDETGADSEETTEQDIQAQSEHRTGQHTSTDEIPLSLPDTTPTKPENIDPFVCVRGSIRRTAHIPASSDPTEPLCVVIDIYNGSGNWTIKSQDTYPNLNERFDLCDLCLRAYDQVNGGEKT